MVRQPPQQLTLKLGRAPIHEQPECPLIGAQLNDSGPTQMLGHQAASDNSWVIQRHAV